MFLRGREITGLPLHRMAHLGIGRSFQITNVFPNLTVLENVRLSAQALGRDNYKLWSPAGRFHRYEEQALAALHEVGLEEKAGALAGILPHGDKRKLELAIILAGDPQVLLLDEPTAGMASEQVPALVEMIARIRADGQQDDHPGRAQHEHRDEHLGPHHRDAPGQGAGRGQPARNRGQRGRAEGVPGGTTA